MRDYSPMSSKNLNESTTPSYIPVSTIIYQQNNNIVIISIQNTETNNPINHNYQNEIPFENDEQNIYDIEERKKKRNPKNKIFLYLAIVIFIFILIENIFLITIGLFFKVILIHLDELGMLIIGILYILRYNEKKKNICIKCLSVTLTIVVWFVGFSFRGFQLAEIDKEFKVGIGIGVCVIFLICRTFLLFFSIPVTIDK